MVAARFLRRAVPPPEPPSLVAGAVTLTPVAADHYAAWREAAAACEGYLRRWQPTWPEGHLGRDSYERRLAIYERDRTRGTGAAWHLFVGEALVGMLRLSGVQRGAARSCEVGYWVAERARGRGHAKAALTAACEHAFGPMDLLRVEAACAVGNEASLAVLRRCGFAFEGIARSYLELDGVRRDHHRLAKLAPGLAAEASSCGAESRDQTRRP